MYVCWFYPADWTQNPLIAYLPTALFVLKTFSLPRLEPRTGQSVETLPHTGNYSCIVTPIQTYLCVRACVVDCGVMSLKWQVVYLVTHCSLLQRLLWRLLEKYANVLRVFIRCQLCKQFLNVYFKNNLLHRSLVYIISFNITPTCFDCFYNGYPQSQCYEFVFDFALCYYIYFHFVNFPVNPLLTCTLPLKAHLTMLSYRLMHILEYYV